MDSVNFGWKKCSDLFANASDEYWEKLPEVAFFCQINVLFLFISGMKDDANHDLSPSSCLTCWAISIHQNI